MAATYDAPAARRFMAGHARLLDRRRFDAVTQPTTASSHGVFGALEGYRNSDGGYGWGLEADLRSSESQPAAALHAFEAMADAGPEVTPRARELCDWLATMSRPDGGLPFAVPLDEPSGSAAWWVGAGQDEKVEASLQITAAVVAQAHRVARHDPAVADHHWLPRATAYCFAAIEQLAEPGAYELAFAIQMADRAASTSPHESETALDRLFSFVPEDGRVPVAGGVEGELLHPLELAPWSDGPAQARLGRDLVAADLERLAATQQADGGWVVDFVSASSAATLEWRGFATVEAVAILRDHGVVGAGD